MSGLDAMDLVQPLLQTCVCEQDILTSIGLSFLSVIGSDFQTQVFLFQTQFSDNIHNKKSRPSWIESRKEDCSPACLVTSQAPPSTQFESDWTSSVRCSPTMTFVGTVHNQCYKQLCGGQWRAPTYFEKYYFRGSSSPLKPATVVSKSIDGITAYIVSST